MAERDLTVPTFLVGGDVPFREIEIPRAHIELLDISLVEELFHKAHMELQANGFVAAWAVLIGGYENDSRELCEIPEVRAWSKKVHVEYPAFPYLLLPGSLMWYLFSLLDLRKAGRRDSSGWTPFILESLDQLDNLSSEISAAILAFLVGEQIPEDMLLSIITEFSLRLSVAFPRIDTIGE